MHYKQRHMLVSRQPTCQKEAAKHFNDRNAFNAFAPHYFFQMTPGVSFPVRIKQHQWWPTKITKRFLDSLST